MPTFARRKSALLASAFTAALIGAPAHAEEAALDGDIIVTANKTEQPLNRVSASIVAQTQDDLSAQSVRSAQDLARVVPALTITSGNNPRGANIAIRGIYSSIGAATTAVYLDDIPLQRRATLGSFSGSGVIFPQMVNLQRVEVLRGPQGTLFGGSAEGGAVRFITMQPDLNDFHYSAKVEGAQTEGGSPTYELGGSVNLPLVAGTLALRASGDIRREGGYIDHVDIYSGQTIGKDTNSVLRKSGHVSLLWQATDTLKVTPAFYASYEKFNDSDTWWEDVAATAVPSRSFNAAGAAYTGSNGPVNFTLPGFTYGPYNVFGPFRTGKNCNIGENYKNTIAPCFTPSTRTATLYAPSLAFDLDLPFGDLHFSNVYLEDRNRGQNDQSYNETGSYQAGVPFLYTFPVFRALATYENKRTAWFQELRLAAKPHSAVRWVAGVYYSKQNTRSESHDFTDLAAWAPALRGVSDTIIYGAPVAANGDVSSRVQTLDETELAAFGQITVPLGSAVRATAGLRASDNRFGYDTQLAGSFFGYAVPTTANGGLSTGVQRQTSVTPKFGLELDVAPGTMAYASAAKGFRMGGVNTGPFAFKCASTFAALGMTDTPRDYDSDSLWSYELGAKTSLFGGKAQVHASAFYVDWRNVQVNYTLPSPCGFAYTTNAGRAISRGFDLETEIRPVEGFSLSFLAGYTDAFYKDALVGPSPTFSVFIPAHTPMPVPRFQYSIGATIERPVGAGATVSLTANFQHTDSYQTGNGPNSSSYNIDTDRTPATNYMTARLAYDFGNTTVALYADNLLNSRDITSRSGGRSCSNATCSTVRSNNPIFTDTTFRPRTLGITLTTRR
ncbi:TonB-dependent receptor [Novosphingobium flavum]|uniref:TonB-dependent receptor n=1 Tax=Novosphingobium flavum TaxID=1778672 RepID=A0A7X1FTG0_9SPHN|nr:TonB-dependent receptor [Novosphingobium flavum]MBC2666152.1 TonB-dependent receptor [Novosphingobium flavum]